MTSSSSWSRKGDKQLFPQLVGTPEQVLCGEIGLHGPQGPPCTAAHHRFRPKSALVSYLVLDPLRRASGRGGSSTMRDDTFLGGAPQGPPFNTHCAHKLLALTFH